MMRMDPAMKVAIQKNLIVQYGHWRSVNVFPYFLPGVNSPDASSLRIRYGCASPSSRMYRLDAGLPRALTSNGQVFELSSASAIAATVLIAAVTLGPRKPHC